MSLRKHLNKLLDVSTVKDLETTKNSLVNDLNEIAKSHRDYRDLTTTIGQLIDFYLAKRAEFIVDIVCSSSEQVITEIFHQLADRLLQSYKDHVNHVSSVPTFPTLLYSLLELILKIVSKEYWWNSLALSQFSPVFWELLRDRGLSCECYVAVVYILSIIVPFSVPALDEKLTNFLCSACTVLLNRIFGDSGVRSASPNLGGDALKSAVMQLVLILYGVFPITFLRHIMTTCPSNVVEYVVSQLRLHPVLSQHLTQGRPTSLSSETSANVITSPGMSQAEVRSKNRFKGKEPSDIVTECLNYEAQSPPKMFSADFPPLESQNQAQQETPTFLNDTDNDVKGIPIPKPFTTRCHHACQPDWCHKCADNDGCENGTADMSHYYSLPTSPGLWMSPSNGSQTVSNEKNSDFEEHVDNSSTTTSPLKDQQPKAQRSLIQLNATIRMMLSEKRQVVESPPNSTSPQTPTEGIPVGYIKSYVRLNQLRTDGAPETEVLREQLRLAHLSLYFEQHRQCIFIAKNRALMTQLAEHQRLNRVLEAHEHRIRELDSSLEREIDRRKLAESKLSGIPHNLPGSLSVSVSQHALQPSDYILADLSPRYRVQKGSGTNTPSAHSALGSTPALGNEQGVESNSSSSITRVHSSGEVSSSNTSSHPETVSTGSLVKREITELKKKRDDLQMELGVLRQQLRQLQLDANASFDEGISKRASQESRNDDAVERIDMLTQQLNDSRREVSALNQLMSEMKERLDNAESDRRRLAADLAHLTLPAVHDHRTRAGSPADAISGQPLPPSQQQQQLQMPNSSGLSASSTSLNNQRQEQYPSLKRQVEKILLTKQEIAVSKD